MPGPGRIPPARPQGRNAGRLPPRAPRWAFRLYVAGASGRSGVALQNLTRLCQELLAGNHDIEVVDLLKHPEQAAAYEIIAIPTVVRLRPGPVRKVLGDLSDRGLAVAGLDLVEAKA